MGVNKNLNYLKENVRKTRNYKILGKIICENYFYFEGNVLGGRKEKY